MKIYPEFATGHQELYFDRELKFWGIPPHPEYEKKKLVSRLPKELITYLNEEPLNAKAQPLKVWNELGPINIEDIIENSSKENLIDFEGEFGKSHQNYSFDIQG